MSHDKQTVKSLPSYLAVVMMLFCEDVGRGTDSKEFHFSPQINFLKVIKSCYRS